MVQDNVIKRRIYWLMAIGWMGMIFALSAQNASDSNEMSGAFVSIINWIITALSFFIDQRILVFLIRKAAHAALYAVLGMIVGHALNPDWHLRIKDVFFILLFCVVYAISDEFHQSFVSGRSAEIRDVMIDGCGSMIGVGIMTLIKKIRKGKNFADMV